MERLRKERLRKESLRMERLRKTLTILETIRMKDSERKDLEILLIPTGITQNGKS
jgi:hypothetical protein